MRKTLLKYKDEIQRALAVCAISTKATAQLLFPDQFYGPFTSGHDEIVRVLDDDNIKKVNLIASRGFGKTSLALLAYAGRNMLFQQKQYIVYVTNSATIAIEKTENLKRQLLTTPTVRTLFQSIRADDYAATGMEEAFTKASWVANGCTLCLPRGPLQQVRGLLFGPHRPDLILIDDLEQVKALNNPDIRKELWEWVRGDVEEAPQSVFDQNFKIVYLDTVKHEDCIPLKLAELPDWHTIVLPLCEESEGDFPFRSWYPELISDEVLCRKWNSHVKAGTEDVFYRENLCRPMSTKTSSFQKQHFQYYHEFDTEFRRNKNELMNIVLVDPAKTTNPAAAETAIVGVGVDLKRRSIFVRRIIHGRFTPDESARLACEVADFVGATVIGWEDAGMGAYALYPVINYVKMNGGKYRIIPLKAGKGTHERGKDERIKGLIPLYRLSMIYHNVDDPETRALEAQLLSFPRAMRKDLPDALGYIVKAMDDAEFYFFPEGHGEQGRDIVEKEYEEFEKEDAREVDWDADVLSMV